MMKYLKIYESFEEYSFEEYCKSYNYDKYINCDRIGLTSLKGIEKFTDIIELYCRYNKLRSLKGIENLTKLKRIDCDNNYIESLEPLANLNLHTLFAYNNKLTSLKGLENCKSFSSLFVERNKIKNLDAIKGKKISILSCYDNDLDEPVPEEIIENCDNAVFYNTDDFRRFQSYEIQKNFLEEHPERIKDLEQFGFSEEIVKEYKELLDFFNVRY